MKAQESNIKAQENNMKGKKLARNITDRLVIVVIHFAKKNLRKIKTF